MRSLFFRHPSHQHTPESAVEPSAALSRRSKTPVGPTEPLQRPARSARSGPRVSAKHRPDVAVAAASPCSSDVDAAMSRRRRTKRDSSTAPSLTGSTGTSDAVAPTGPVQIPGRQLKRGPPTAHRRKHARHVHSTEALHPSLAALLAVTDIPRHRRRPASPDRALIIDDVDHHVSEKDLSLSLGHGGALELLLSPPGAATDINVAESTARCALARTTSADSIPSLGGDSFTSDTLSSLDTPITFASSSPRRRPSPVRRSLEPVSCPADAADEHPLAADLAAELRAFDADDERPADKAPKPPAPETCKPLRAVFRSNLTASLRALRSAARSFSSTNQPASPADALLSRSVLAIDSKVPYADERRPPMSEEMPSAELRRYLNPTTSSLIDPQPQSSRAYSASIQMQTYKVQRSRCPQPSSRQSVASAPCTGPHPPSHAGGPALVPGMRQREMRENSDFIRIAVMEMAMRKRGKLDSNKPGRARWALPPRRPPTKAYEIGLNGVPARWVPMSS